MQKRTQFFAILAALTLCGAMPCSAAVLGDTNGDGVLDSDDACMMLKAYADTLVTGTISAEAAAWDVTGDGVLDSDDAVQLLRYQTFSMLTESNLDIRSAAACAFDSSVYRTSVPADAAAETILYFYQDGTTATLDADTAYGWLNDLLGDPDCAATDGMLNFAEGLPQIPQGQMALYVAFAEPQDLRVYAAASMEGNIQALDLMGVESLTAVQEGETIQLYLQMSGDTDCATASFGYFEPDTAMLTLD